ncbi:hypothetical protein N9Y89_01630 [bacterium]|nr:hypothetical protein [bacterium]
MYETFESKLSLQNYYTTFLKCLLEEKKYTSFGGGYFFANYMIDAISKVYHVGLLLYLLREISLKKA